VDYVTENNEDFYKSLFKNNREIMLLINPITYKIEDCNLSACYFYGYPYEEMLKLKITNFNIISKVQVDKEMNLAIDEKKEHFYFKHRLSNGQVRDVEVHSTPINLQGKNLLFSIISDITMSGIYNDKLKTENAYLEKTVAERTYNLEQINTKLVDTNGILDKSNTMLSAIIESSPEVIIFTLDCNYCYLAFNKKHKNSIKKIWGKDIEIGMNMLDVIGKHEDYMKAKTNFDRALAGESFTMIEEYGDESFSRLFWQDSWSPIMSTKGKVIGLTCFVIDVTELKRTEAVLNQEKIFIEALLESIPGYLYVYDESGKLIRWNKKHEEMTGYSAEEMSLMTLDKWFEGEDFKRVSEAVEKVFKIGSGEVEAHLIVKGGGKLHVLTNGVRLILDGKTYFTGVGIDITQRKKDEEKLKESERQFRYAVEEAPIPIMLHAQGGEVIKISRAWTDVTGYTLEDIPTIALWSDKAYGTKIEEVLSEFKSLFNLDKRQNDGQFNVKTKDGHVRIWDFYSAYIGKLQDGRRMVMSVAIDVTEHKRVEIALALEKELLETTLKSVEFLSYHDQLTGLYNRRFYEEELKRLDTESSLPMTIVMGDVNGLKLINDSFGHIMGDELLKKVAHVINKGCRADDIIARLGGDEFVIILPKTDSFEAKQIIRRINDLSSKEKLASTDISISFGYETKYNVEEEIQDIFKSAEDHMYKNKLFEGPSMRSKTIKAIINTLHEKNKREEQHSHRVSSLCKSMGEALCLAEKEIQELELVGLLHDIGKIGIDENILNKPGILTEAEWKEIKRHPEIGYRILNTVNDMFDMAKYVLNHHERWDGKGYPKGLKSDEIPFISRIITIADAYDAMTSERSYKSAMSEEIATEELQKNAGIQFDPELVSIFIKKRT